MSSATSTFPRRSCAILYTNLPVYCRCLRSLQRPNCPLCRCRIPLESDSEPPFTRLRVDIGRKDPEFADADDYAQTLMTSISNVANNGSSEQQLTELIHDCKKFLHAQPREKVSGAPSVLDFH